MIDAFTRHFGIFIVGLAALIFDLGVVWQVVHSHDVDPLLAGLAGTTTGALLNPQSNRVTVENDPSDPVPTADVPAKTRRRDKGGIVLELVIAILLVLLVAAVLGIR